LLHGREFFGGQGLQREARFARLHGQALVLQRHRDVARFRQRAQDVQQLARATVVPVTSAPEPISAWW
jgi:hypothetical protein